LIGPGKSSKEFACPGVELYSELHLPKNESRFGLRILRSSANFLPQSTVAMLGLRSFLGKFPNISGWDVASLFVYISCSGNTTYDIVGFGIRQAEGSLYGKLNHIG
jgi:hypothetical protein